ncbi:MAG TPA: hypothetical protein PLN06_07630 [Bacteroidales bacterium]|nr:hypothetical protein [Prolixibacteraceae bacterium]HOU96478.1 hypothetical protein [Bacteroidales bacterium]HPD57991.1 hypothetical protein [Smithellaceae bacterium]
MCLDETKPIKQYCGAVYGIVVESDTPPSTGLKPLKDYPKLFPVYWGKDIAPVSHIIAHVQNHKSTGNANLRNISELKDKRIIFGAIFVERYRDFEEHLHKTYPLLKGSKKHGGGEKIIKILK